MDRWENEYSSGSDVLTFGFRKHGKEDSFPVSQPARTPPSFSCSLNHPGLQSPLFIHPSQYVPHYIEVIWIWFFLDGEKNCLFPALVATRRGGKASPRLPQTLQNHLRHVAYVETVCSLCKQSFETSSHCMFPTKLWSWHPCSLHTLEAEHSVHSA